MNSDELQGFVNQVESEFRQRFSHAIDDLSIATAFRAFRCTLTAGIITLPRPETAKKETCSKCGDVVYRVKKP
jgi:hypothetical protein